jgi:hypothetical protein
VAHHADVQRPLIDQEPDLGAFGGRRAFAGVLLDEGAERRRGAPGVLGDAAVDGRPVLALQSPDGELRDFLRSRRDTQP